MSPPKTHPGPRQATAGIIVPMIHSRQHKAPASAAEHVPGPESSVLIVTTDTIPNRDIIQVHGIVKGNIARPRSEDGSPLLASALQKAAHTMGANAVVGTRIAYDNAGRHYFRHSLYGTAVTVSPEPSLDES